MEVDGRLKEWEEGRPEDEAWCLRPAHLAQLSNTRYSSDSIGSNRIQTLPYLPTCLPITRFPRIHPSLRQTKKRKAPKMQSCCILQTHAGIFPDRPLRPPKRGCSFAIWPTPVVYLPQGVCWSFRRTTRTSSLAPAIRITDGSCPKRWPEGKGREGGAAKSSRTPCRAT